MPWWYIFICSICCLIIGGILGFLITKKIIQKQIRDNPPITEKQIRAMYLQMGRKPSEANIKKVMNSIKRAK